MTKGVEREVRHIELDVSGWGINYASGDALAVMPLNPLNSGEAHAAQAVERIERHVLARWSVLDDVGPLDDSIIAIIRESAPREHDWLAIGIKRMYWCARSRACSPTHTTHKRVRVCACDSEEVLVW